MNTYIENNIKTSTVRSYHGKAGWIIEFIHPQLQSQKKQLLSELERLLNNLPNTIKKDIIWKLFLYSSEEERFKENGTLHTNQEEHDSTGNAIITLGGSDCYVDLTEFDCEIISFNNYHGLKMVSRISFNSQNKPILAYTPGIRYLWLEAMGGHYEIDAVSEDKKNPRNLTISLRQ